jgi:hypothetical protein
MPEMMATLNAIQESEKRRNKFMAALQGVDLDEHNSNEKATQSSGPVTLEQVQARAVARLTGDQNLAGAIEQGITPEMGLNYNIVSEGTEFG